MGQRNNIEATDEAIDRLTQLQLDLMKCTGLGNRGQHYKGHGCVRAKFEVLADIPDQYKIGLFATPGSYSAYIRFSNGAEFDDTKADIHGMAIKLTGVPGRKVLEAESSAETHDFVLADKPVFFIRDREGYSRFVENFAETAPKGKAPLKFVAWLALHHPTDMPTLLGFRRQAQDSPLAARYWSQVPYAFGSGMGTICRYGAIPKDGNIISKIPSVQRDQDYLRRAMVDHLTSARRSAAFDFTVQLRTDATPAVIDNPTILWNTPEQRVAVITIPPQNFDSPEQTRFGENLSYTPWHALPEHRPVGQINEIRKAAYLASSKLRHETNHTKASEPIGTEFDSLTGGYRSTRDVLLEHDPIALSTIFSERRYPFFGIVL